MLSQYIFGWIDLCRNIHNLHLVSISRLLTHWNTVIFHQFNLLEIVLQLIYPLFLRWRTQICRFHRRLNIHLLIISNIHQIFVCDRPSDWLCIKCVWITLRQVFRNLYLTWKADFLLHISDIIWAAFVVGQSWLLFLAADPTHENGRWTTVIASLWNRWNILRRQSFFYYRVHSLHINLHVRQFKFAGPWAWCGANWLWLLPWDILTQSHYVPRHHVRHLNDQLFIQIQLFVTVPLSETEILGVTCPQRQGRFASRLAHLEHCVHLLESELIEISV